MDDPVKARRSQDARRQEERGEDFGAVFRDELEEVRERRRKAFFVADGGDAARPKNLVGLALSGGGIRSATFCLGLLQGLHELRLLRAFDYLSTVSGGGYVGGWWSAWLSRESDGAPGGEEPPRFEPGSIRNPASLIVKIAQSDDPVSKALRCQIKRDAKTHNLFAQYKEGDAPSPALLAALEAELNGYLQRTDTKPDDLFAGLPMSRAAAPRRKFRCVLRDEEWSKENRAREEAAATLLGKIYPAANRRTLERTYPYELLDVFPPDEKIEPQRSYGDELQGRTAEGSLHASQDPIHHLRLFANYLTPRRGMLSADTWRAVSVIARNVILTWLILLPFLIALTLLGQLYFLLYPGTAPGGLTTMQAFLRLCPEGTAACNSAVVGYWPFVPVAAAFVGWIAWVSVFWLICNREKSSPTDLIVQSLTFAVVVVMLLAGVNVASNIYFQQDIIRWALANLNAAEWAAIGGWLLVALALLAFALRPQSEAEDLVPKGGVSDGRWRREVRRNRFSRIQTRLLVWMVLCLVVLAVAGYSHVVMWNVFNPPRLGNVPIPVGLIPLISAVGGSIFTAFKATPKGGGEKAAVREPSLVSRVIFAVTPVLVVTVLAVSVTSLSHSLLSALISAESADGGGPVVARDAVEALLRVAGSFGVALCLALAVYEMKNVEWRNVLSPSPGLLVFSFLLACDLGWALHNILHNIRHNIGSDTPTSAQPPADPSNIFTALLAVLPDVLAIFAVVAIALIRVTAGPPGSAPQGRSRKSRLRIIRAVWKRVYETPRRLKWAFGSVLLVFTALGLAVGWKLSSILEGMEPPRGAGQAGQSWLAIFPYGLAIVAGSFVLFRLLVVKERREGAPSLRARWLGGRDARRAWVVWAFAAACAVLPLCLLCWGHALGHIIYGQPKQNPDVMKEVVFLGLFPVAVTLLSVLLIYLRETVTRAVTAEGLLVAQWARGLSQRLLRKLPGGAEHERFAYKVVAVLTLAYPLFYQCLAGERNYTPYSMFFPGGGYLLSALLLLSFPLFSISVFQLPDRRAVPRHAAAPSSAAVKSRRRLVLWGLAFVCVVVAAASGKLLSKWANLAALNGEVLTSGTAGIALLGMAACLTLIVFDLIWATRDNKGSMLLLAFAYLGFAAFLVLGSEMASANAPLRSARIVLGMLAAALVWIVALGWMVDPNTVSMHQFYKGRLVRAYLGASNVKRMRHGNKEVTETVAGDDLSLKDVSNCDRGGPYHLINVTLNLAAGRDLSTAQRSAAAFTLAPLYCGSRRTDFRPTGQYMNGQLSLGTAVATSGAAVSPSMGSKKPTAALAMLMTLLNVRLGYWAPTPYRETWRLAQPRLWPFYLLREFLSQTNDLSSYCYLTDGGHFDNTGLYSLVERGCRYILLADCGADPNRCFQDLGEAIRRCRIDFNAEIELPIDPFLESEGGAAKCFAVGSITYSKEHVAPLLGAAESAVGEDATQGVIIYLKPAIIDEVSADVRQYSRENRFFPQQSTTNQWFGEAQFESYRRLGELCTKEVFGSLDEVLQFNNIAGYSEDSIGAIFKALAKHEKLTPGSTPLRSAGVKTG